MAPAGVAYGLSDPIRNIYFLHLFLSAHAKGQYSCERLI